MATLMFLGDVASIISLIARSSARKGNEYVEISSACATKFYALTVTIILTGQQLPLSAVAASLDAYGDFRQVMISEYQVFVLDLLDRRPSAPSSFRLGVKYATIACESCDSGTRFD